MTAELFATVDSSRIRVLDAPILLPGTCCICGTSRTDDRKYVDLGIDVDHVGVMYFCTFCITELTNQLGCLTQEQSQQLVDELDAAKQTILEFQEQKAALDGAVDTLRRTGLFSGTDFSPVLSSQQVLDSEPEPVADVSEPKQSATRSGKNSKQSDSKQRPNDISDNGMGDLTDFSL